jgi:hypothetical protein
MATDSLSAEAAQLEATYARALTPYEGPLVLTTLLLEATAATGLSDLGGSRWGEPAFRAKMELLCNGLDGDPALTPLGRTRAHSRLHVMLCSRLRFVAWRKIHAEAAPIVAPLVGTGLPRAGTTFLHNLLSQDPDNLVATAAQAAIPIPPPATIGAEDEAARTELYQRVLDLQGFSEPDILRIHPYSAAMPEECCFLQEAAPGHLYRAYFDAPAFEAAAVEGVAEAYRWQAAIMQTLQAGRGQSRWLLKHPGHLVFWEVMVDSYPDARIFMSHRDPAKVLPSVASLMTANRRRFYARGPDPKALGASLLASWRTVLDRVHAWRSANPSMPVVDVHYVDLISDPVGRAEHLYAAFGLPLSGGVKDRMRRFVQDDRHGKGPQRQYGLSDFGLTEADIERAFGGYIDRYGIARESRQ